MNTNNDKDLLKKVDRLNVLAGLDIWYFVTSSKDTAKYEKYHNNTISFAEVQNCITNFANEEK